MNKKALVILALAASMSAWAQGTGIVEKRIAQPYADAAYRTVSDKAMESLSVKDFGAIGNGVANDTAAFVKACAKGKRVIAPDAAYKLVGEIPMVSGCSFEFTGNPVISFDVSGENGRGFWFGPGVENAAILGSATINATASAAGSDGSRNGVFSFGGDFYLTADPLPTRRNRVEGEFLVKSIGAANVKAVQMHGYVEDVTIKGVTATGQMNYAFVAHWAGNGAAGALPTKTWHPNRITFINSRAVHDISLGSLLRGFTVSAVGQVNYENTHTVDAQTLGFNFFVGDYGYTYAQNLNSSNAFNVSLSHSSAEGVSTALSVDGISSRLNGSPYWTGAQYNATVAVDGFLARMKTGANAIDIAVSGVANFRAKNLRVIEEADGNAQQAMQLTSNKSVHLDGEILAKGGVLVRDIGSIDYQMHTRRLVETHDVTSYAIGVTALSNATTAGAAVSVGGTALVIASATNVIGPGGFVRYNDGAADYEMEIRSMTYSGGAQTLVISPAPVAIPNGAALTLIQTVKRMEVGPVVLSGARSLVRITGTATAKPRNIAFVGTQFIRSGLADIEAAQVDGLSVVGTFHDQAGQTTTTTSTAGILLGADAENFRVNGARFGRNNKRVRYLVQVDNAAKNGVINNSIFESINSGVANPAAIFKQSATNVVISGNATAAGVTAVYP